jgi:hypothetical protein
MWGVLGVIVAAGLGWKLYRNFQLASARKQKANAALFAKVLALIEDPSLEQQGAHEFPRLSGTYRGFPVQIRPVVDTLPTRRLPALWLLVTLQDELAIKARFDMMMRPAGPTTFSNFDLLPRTLAQPLGFPEHAVIRTDDAAHVMPAEIIRPHIAAFFGAQAKELLITGHGLRIVWLLAEADRVRYGIFRQAEFGDIEIEANVLRGILDNLLEIRQAVLAWAGETQ